MKREEAERALVRWRTARENRDQLVRDAYAAGVSKYAIVKLTGLGRSTVDRILAAAGHAT